MALQKYLQLSCTCSQRQDCLVHADAIRVEIPPGRFTPYQARYPWDGAPSTAPRCTLHRDHRSHWPHISAGVSTMRASPLSTRDSSRPGRAGGPWRDSMYGASRFHCTAQRPICTRRVPRTTLRDIFYPLEKTRKREKKAPGIIMASTSRSRPGENGNKKAGSGARAQGRGLSRSCEQGLRGWTAKTLRAKPLSSSDTGKGCWASRSSRSSRLSPLLRASAITAPALCHTLHDHSASRGGLEPRSHPAPRLPHRARLSTHRPCLPGSPFVGARARTVNAGSMSHRPLSPPGGPLHSQRQRAHKRVPRVSPHSRLMSRSAFRQRHRGLVLHNNSASQGCRGSTASVPSPCRATVGTSQLGGCRVASNARMASHPPCFPSSPSAL
ncbi:hypothetical protein DFH06DRAFT_751318 [Mycena polygramma]|nr:hypothetical protein DFH06DRAFT_751318 [Mycena polygramma]